MLSVGWIADQAFRARTTADDAIAEVHSVREQVESRIVDLTRRTEIGTSSVLGEVTSQVRQFVEQSQAQTSRAVGDAVQ